MSRSCGTRRRGDLRVPLSGQAVRGTSRASSSTWPWTPTIRRRHWPESRVFTIANGGNQELIRLTIADKGRFTGGFSQELKPGSKVWMKAPYGEFIVRTEPR